MEVCVLASGSKGNSTVIKDGQSAIVIDCGLSGKEFKKRLDSEGISEEIIKAVIVSHEHSDHISGAGILSRKYSVPLYINKKTFAAAEKKIGKIDDMVFFECGEAFIVSDFTIHPFSISHDTSDPAGFTIMAGDIKAGIATDLGKTNLIVKQHLQGCNILILEANHDLEMLLSNDNYPWPLKQRVKGRHGHLSNDDSAELLEELIHENLKCVVMAHLSEENNHPEKVKDSILKVVNGHDIKLIIANQNYSTGLIEIN